MTFNDLFRDGQSDAAALVAAPLMQPLEHLEHAVAILFVYSDAVIFDAEKQFVVLSLPVDLDVRRTLAAEFQCIPDKILKYLRELHAVRGCVRQVLTNDFRVAVLDCQLEVVKDVPDRANP
ncbi:MAG: hypothetical protein WCA56_10625 [Xanthobacteraceae bacterium]